MPVDDLLAAPFLLAKTPSTNWLHCYHASTKRPSRVQRSGDDIGDHDLWLTRF